MTLPYPLILASASPRRREILTTAGIGFEVRVADVAEKALDGESGEDYVRRLAREKAVAVGAGGKRIVLAADTVVHVDGQILEKPADQTDARRMLRLLSGRTHEVITGICLAYPGGVIVEAESTKVRFVALSADEIEAYVETREPMDKAGAYAIQGRASKFIDRVEGCYFNVVGLPVALVYRHLNRLAHGVRPASA